MLLQFLIISGSLPQHVFVLSSSTHPQSVAAHGRPCLSLVLQEVSSCLKEGFSFPLSPKRNNGGRHADQDWFSIAVESQTEMVFVDDFILKPDYIMTTFFNFANSISTVHSVVGKVAHPQKSPDPAVVTRPLRNVQPIFSHFMRNSWLFQPDAVQGDSVTLGSTRPHWVLTGESKKTFPTVVMLFMWSTGGVNIYLFGFFRLWCSCCISTKIYEVHSLFSV